MDWMIATGSVSLGLLVGAMVGWFVSEAEKMDHKALWAAVSIVSGGGVLALFGAFSNTMPSEVWLYPAGALIGFIITTALELRYYDYYGTPRKSKNSN